MANLWTAGSSLMATVGTIANTTSRTVETLASGIDMIDTYVESARKNQVVKHKIADAHFLENLIQESTLEQAKREQAIAKQLSDQDLKQRYDLIEQRTRALFAPST